MPGLDKFGFFGCACTVDPRDTPHKGVNPANYKSNPVFNIQHEPGDDVPIKLDEGDHKKPVYQAILFFVGDVREKAKKTETPTTWDTKQKEGLRIALRTKAGLSSQSTDYKKYDGHGKVSTGLPDDAEKITRLRRWQQARDAYSALIEERKPRGEDFFALLAIAVDEPYRDANSEQGTARGECLTTQVKAFFEANPARLDNFDPDQLLRPKFCCVM